MKTLHLLRHAKSSWRDIGQDDHHRPLGRGAARAMAKYMKRAGIEPDVVLCSTAVRAKETRLRAPEQFCTATNRRALE